MKKPIFGLILLLLSATLVWGGTIRIYECDQISGNTGAEKSGVTIPTGTSADTGVSRICTIDLESMTDLVGNFSLTMPSGGRGIERNQSGVTVITFGVRTAASGYTGPTGVSSTQGTGNSTTAGVTIPYFYVVTNTWKTAEEIEALTTTGVTSICAQAVDSAGTPFVPVEFTPESGRYLHILVGSSSTDYNKPGAYISVH